MVMKSLIAWSRQPTTVTAVATLAGTAAALATHQMTTANALPLIVGSLLGMAMPDNGGAKVAVQNLVTDAIRAEQLVMTPELGVTVTAKSER